MSTKQRIFREQTLIHCYQKTKQGFLLFYNISDYLVHFTITSIVAKRYGIRIVAFCQMPDHTHLGIIAPSLEALSAFYRDSTSIFVRYGQAPECRRGPLFRIHFGSAPKIGQKKIRTNLIYIGNNPVERKLSTYAESYRWNYLAYASSSHPFSERLIIRDASPALKKAIAEVDGSYERNQPMRYAQLQRLFKSLFRKEQLQLVDYIVDTYSAIDYDYSAEMFGSIDNMVNAMRYNTGSEYDIRESFTGQSDTCYALISSWLINNLGLTDVHEVFRLNQEKRQEIFIELYNQLHIDPRQIAKYLRLEYPIPD